MFVFKTKSLAIVATKEKNMGFIGGNLGYKILKIIAPRTKNDQTVHDDSDNELKLQQYYGNNIFKRVANKTVIDFGCGQGNQAVEIAKMSKTTNMIGLDIQKRHLKKGIKKAKELSVSNRCKFSTTTNELADIILSKDAFEHFSNPSEILEIMSRLLKPNGYVLAAFGPTWYHPYGGHLFSTFPWSHLIFTEKAQILWRSDFKTDGATKFSEVDGGLNQITINQFEQIVQKSPFSLDFLETIPLKGISILRSKLLREFGSSIVRCKLSLN